MTTNETPEKELAKEPKTKSPLTAAISKNTKILAAFAVTCTLAVALVSEFTVDTIKRQEQQNLLKTLHDIIEPSRYDNDIANDCIIVSSPELGSDKVHKAYIARKSGDVVAVALTSTAPEGYNGNIEFIIAINVDGSVSGTRILKHQETPGLGDKIEIKKSNWINSFAGKSLLSDNDSRWAVAKDNGIFDQFTGATITPRAVVKGIKQTISYFNKNKAHLLALPNACTLAVIEPSIAKQQAQSKTELESSVKFDEVTDTKSADAQLTGNIENESDSKLDSEPTEKSNEVINEQ